MRRGAAGRRRREDNGMRIEKYGRDSIRKDWMEKEDRQSESEEGATGEEDEGKMMACG